MDLWSWHLAHKQSGRVAETRATNGGRAKWLADLCLKCDSRAAELIIERHTREGIGCRPSGALNEQNGKPPVLSVGRHGRQLDI